MVTNIPKTFLEAICSSSWEILFPDKDDGQELSEGDKQALGLSPLPPSKS